MMKDTLRTRIIKKPWGFEEIWAETSDYVGKILHINKDCKLSRQYHIKKEETIRVMSGVLTLEIGIPDKDLDIRQLKAGESFHIKPGLVHRFCAIDADVDLVEVSKPFLQDVVRLDDDYRRN